MALLDGKLSVTDGAAYIGCSGSFLRDRARRGDVASVRVGNRYYFEKSVLDKLVSEPHNAPENTGDLDL